MAPRGKVNADFLPALHSHPGAVLPSDFSLAQEMHLYTLLGDYKMGDLRRWGMSDLEGKKGRKKIRNESLKYKNTNQA